MVSTPISIARPKIKINIDDSNYSHTTQTRWDNSDITTTMGVTFNRTRTFDSKGNPKDSDND